MNWDKIRGGIGAVIKKVIHILNYSCFTRVINWFRDIEVFIIATTEIMVGGNTNKSRA